MKLFYRHYPSSKRETPLYILHGLFGSSDNWHTLAKRFSEHFPVYAFDLRNHGLSPHGAPHDYPSMAADLKETIMADKLPIPFHLLGHSMGAKVALNFLTHSPQDLKTLILVDMTEREYPPGHTIILQALQSLPLDQIKSRKMADQWLQKWIPDFAIRQFLLKSLVLDPATQKYHWRFNLEQLIQDYEKILKPIPLPTRIDIPTLLIFGEQSDYVNEEDIRRLSQIFSQIRFLKFKGVGHWVHAESPELFYQNVVAFLNAN